MEIAERFAPGARVGRYSLVGLLGEGGMGAVYRAYDETLRRNVALKVVRRSVGATGEDDAVSRRILREARMAASFGHPNVVAIFDVGEHEGTPFIVMEVVEGRSLRELVGAGAPPATRASWIIDVARGLAAAHRRGLVHRDIKPENVMVSDEGTVKVLDFGIAGPTEHAGGTVRVASGATTGQTFATLERGVISGTPAYMAPEVIREGVFDARSDQFAWGVLAYELLSGVHPFGADAGVGLEALLSAITQTDVPPLDAARLGIAPTLAAAISRSLERAPAARFASMDAVLDAVGVLAPSPVSAPGTRDVDVQAPTLAVAGASSGAPISTSSMATAAATARTVASPGRTARRARRLAAVAAVAAVVGGGVLTYVAMRRNAPPSFEVHSMRRLAFGASYSEYPSFTADGTTLVYDAADGKEDQVYRFDVASGTRTALTTGLGWHYAAAVSPSGHAVAYLKVDDEGEGAFFVPIDGSAPPKRITTGTLAPSWVPDGSAIWAGSKARPERFDAVTFDAQRKLDKPETGRYMSVLEMPDGRVVASLQVQGGRGIGVVLHEADGAQRWLWREPVEDGLALVPGRSWLLASKVSDAGLTELWQVPIDEGSARRVGGGDVAPKTGLTISASGDRLAWSTAHPTTMLARLEPEASGAEALRRESSADRRQWRDDHVRAIPRSNGLVVISDRRGATELWVVDPTGADHPRPLTDGGSVHAHAVSPDGQWVVYATGTSGIFLTRVDGTLAPQAITNDAHDATPVFSADGETIYFSRGVAAGSVEIHSIPRGGGATSRVLSAPASAPEISPDGRTLAYVSSRSPGEVSVHALELATGTSRALPGFPTGGYVGLRWAPDGRRMFAYTSQRIVEVDVESGEIVHRFDAGIDEITGATYSGDSVLVSLRVWEGDVWIAEGSFR